MGDGSIVAEDVTVKVADGVLVAGWGGRVLVGVNIKGVEETVEVAVGVFVGMKNVPVAVKVGLEVGEPVGVGVTTKGVGVVVAPPLLLLLLLFPPPPPPDSTVLDG